MHECTNFRFDATHDISEFIESIFVVVVLFFWFSDIFNGRFFEFNCRKISIEIDVMSVQSSFTSSMLTLLEIEFETIGISRWHNMNTNLISKNRTFLFFFSSHLILTYVIDQFRNIINFIIINTKIFD